MNSSVKWWIALGLVLALGSVFRFAGLHLRPMHTDEAVHGVKFGYLLEDGFYKYNPNQFHGPTLNYLTLIPAWLTGTHQIEKVSEQLLRIVPAVFGIGIIILVFFLRDRNTPTAIFWSVVFAALSPAMVFYSRYYIQETLLVFFVFGLIVFGYRYLCNRRLIWIILAGICAGLAFATKETSVIAFASIAVSAVVVYLIPNRQKAAANKTQKIKPLHIIYALIAAIGISALFFSSFGSNISGITDSVKIFEPYLLRAGQSPKHIHPWYYYFQILLFWHEGAGPIWNELVIVIPAIAGCFLSFFGNVPGDRRFRQFIAVYIVVMAAVYAAIPYKTPWCMLGFLQPMTLMAGLAVAWCFSKITARFKPLLFILAAAGCAYLGYLTLMSNFRYYDHPANPYTYSHPTGDVFKIDEKLDDLARASDRPLIVRVIYPDHEYWPLPWYFRDLPKTGWHSEVTDKIGDADIIIADLRLRPPITEVLYEHRVPGQRNLYVPAFAQWQRLRPGARVQMYVRATLWQRMRQIPLRAGSAIEND